MLKSFLTKVGITWVVVLLAGVFVAVAVASFSTLRPEAKVSIFAFAVTAAFLAATFASIVVMMPITTTIRALLGRGGTRRRAITRAVTRRSTDTELDPELRSPALAYAGILQDYIPMQIVQNGSLYIALLLTQAVNIGQGSARFFGWSVAMIVLLIGVFAVFGPLMLRQRANARLFIQQNQLAPVVA